MVLSIFRTVETQSRVPRASLVSSSFRRTAWNATGPNLAAGVSPYMAFKGLRAMFTFTSSWGAVAMMWRGIRGSALSRAVSSGLLAPAFPPDCRPRASHSLTTRSYSGPGLMGVPGTEVVVDAAQGDDGLTARPVSPIGWDRRRFRGSGHAESPH